jgi:hypothetical protein
MSAFAKARANEQAGKIELVDGIIRYQSEFFGTWTLPASEVFLFGEYTTDQGPVIDDWFMVFVPAGKREWYEASVYAEGADQFRSQLAAQLNVDTLYGELASHTDYASRIIWPSQLAGRPLFKFEEVNMSLWEKVVRLGCGQIRFSFSSDVEALITKSN